MISSLSWVKKVDYPIWHDKLKMLSNSESFLRKKGRKIVLSQSKKCLTESKNVFIELL